MKPLVRSAVRRSAKFINRHAVALMLAATGVAFYAWGLHMQLEAAEQMGVCK